MDALLHHMSPTGDTIAPKTLKQGYETWAITIEHPDRDVLDPYLGFPHVKMSQWKLRYRHGSFPSILHVGMVISFEDQSYILLAIGSNSLRVQALTPDAFSDHPARWIGDTGAFMMTPSREERLRRRQDNRRRNNKEHCNRRNIDAPRYRQAVGPRFCYELTVRTLPRTLCDALPSWTRGGSCEESASMLRACYVQLYLLDLETDELVLWEPHSGLLDTAKLDTATLPDHCKVVREMRDLAEAPVVTLTQEEATALVRLIEDPEQPAPVTFVAPASFLTKEMRKMIAPVISFPASSPLTENAFPRRVSLERGQQVALPRKIARLRVDALGLMASTLACLAQADITTLGEFLELEEEQLVALLNPEGIWDIHVAIAASGALPVYASASQEYPEDAPAQEKTLTRLPQFEIAVSDRERILCEFDDSSVQEVTQVRERQGILQVQQGTDGEWIAPKRFWTSLKRSQHMENERRVAHVSSLSGFLPADDPENDEQGSPIFEEFFYQLAGTTYDDPDQGRLYLAYATTVVGRLDGRQSGSVQTIWLTRKQVGQSLRWDPSLKNLDTLDLRALVNAHAQRRGADQVTLLPQEDLDLARKQRQMQAENAYNRVPVRDPYSRKDQPQPLELFVSCGDLEAATAKQASPLEAIMKAVERYIKYPEALPLGDQLPPRMLITLYDTLKEDLTRVRKLNQVWDQLFPGQPHPQTVSLVREKAYTMHTVLEWDEQKKARVEKEEPELIGYRFIIGVLATVPVPPRFVLEPRQEKPIIPIPEPITFKRIPNYVIVEGKGTKIEARKAAA